MSELSSHRRAAAALLLGALLCGALLGGRAAAEACERCERGSQLSLGDSASEYWDLVARLESGYSVFARFLITNEGPGDRTAVAVGHLVRPDGGSVPFQNGRREGRWKLSPDGLRIEIGSSVLDQRGVLTLFEHDNDKRGIKLFLNFPSEGKPLGPEQPAPRGYHFQVLELGAPVSGSVWVKGMDAPLPVRGTAALTHTWMEKTESQLALRRTEFFSLAADPALYLSEVTTPDGERAAWLVTGRDGQSRRRTPAVDVTLIGTLPGPRSDQYPVPAGLRVAGEGVAGEIELSRVLMRHDPTEVLPQPFRLLLSFKTRPERVWTEAPFDVTLGAGPGSPPIRIRGSGIATVTFLNPLPDAAVRPSQRAPGA